MKKIINKILKYFNEVYMNGLEAFDPYEEYQRKLDIRKLEMMAINVRLAIIIRSCMTLEQLRSSWDMVDLHLERYSDVADDNDRNMLMMCLRTKYDGIMYTDSISTI